MNVSPAALTSYVPASILGPAIPPATSVLEIGCSAFVAGADVGISVGFAVSVAVGSTVGSGDFVGSTVGSITSSPTVIEPAIPANLLP